MTSSIEEPVTQPVSDRQRAYAISTVAGIVPVAVGGVILLQSAGHSGTAVAACTALSVLLAKSTTTLLNSSAVYHGPVRPVEPFYAHPVAKTVGFLTPAATVFAVFMAFPHVEAGFKQILPQSDFLVAAKPAPQFNAVSSMSSGDGVCAAPVEARLVVKVQEPSI